MKTNPPPQSRRCGKSASALLQGRGRPCHIVRFAVAAALGAVLTAAAAVDDGDAALDLARRTLAYVAKSVPADKLKPYADELELDAKWLAGEKLPGYRAGIIREIRKLRRRILFLHPDLQFDKLLAVQRGLPYTWDLHMVDQYLGRFSRPGPGLVVLENWKGLPRKTALLKGKLPTGTVLNPDLHWDADRIIFAFCDHTAKPPADAKALKVHPDANITPWMAASTPWCTAATSSTSALRTAAGCVSSPARRTTRWRRWKGGRR